MGWRIVKQPNGLFARFSEVVDDFTHYDMTEAEAVDLCCRDMSKGDAIAKVLRGVNDEPVPGFLKARGRNDGLDRWRDAIETITVIHGKKVANRRTKQMS